VNSSFARVVERIAFGSFVTSTGVFTDGSAWTTPKMASRLYLYITTGTGSSNDTITVTYTNHLGVTGHTGTVIVKSNAIGERIEVPLQAGDIGVLDVTNVTQSITQAGAFNVEGTYGIFFAALTTVNVGYQTTVSLNSAVIPQGSTVVLQYNSSNVSGVTRRVSLVGTLVPR